LPGARWPPEDHAARNQLLEPRDLIGVGRPVPLLERVENLGLELLLHLVVAADVLLEIDARNLHLTAECGLAHLGVSPLGVRRVRLAFEGDEQLPEPDGVDARDVLVELPRREVAAELPALLLRDEVAQPVP